jgi:hypothetical protein
MSGDDPDGSRVVCAVLAAQMAALRDRIQAFSAVEQLWQASDRLAQLPDPAAVEIGRGLQDLAFMQAQSQDLVNQTADCVTAALQRLAQASPIGPEDLQALYVCDDQRRVHDLATSAFAAKMP